MALPISLFVFIAAGRYPGGRDLYFGLLRLGMDAPGLPPPQKRSRSHDADT